MRSALETVWHADSAHFGYLQPIHQAALESLFRNNSEETSMEEKISQLANIVTVNLGDKSDSPMEDLLTYSRNWSGRGKLALIKPTQGLIEQL